jgi:hypothetical protein
MSVPKPPDGTGPAGRKLWRSVLTGFELDEHERLLLAQAARVADVCADLQGVVDAEGALLVAGGGEQRAHPALVELRQQRILLARLLVALRVPVGDEEAEQAGRLQRRGLRGVYGGAA